MIIEGKRGMPKVIIKNIPCPHCTFVGENICELGVHFDIVHPFPPLLFASSEFENQYYSILGKNQNNPDRKMTVEDNQNKKKFEDYFMKGEVTCMECGLFRECAINGYNYYCRECIENVDRLKWFKSLLK